MRQVLPVLLLWLSACGTAPGGDPLRVVPASAEAALIVPSVAELQARASRFLAGIEGASGALELVADRYGLDLRTPEGGAALGLDMSRGLALYSQRLECEAAPCPLALVAAFSVSDAERFLKNVGGRIQRAAGLSPKSAPGAELELFGSDEVGVALGVTVDKVGLVTVVPAPADAAALWKRASATPAESLVGSPRDANAQALLGDSTVRLVMGQILPEVPDGLGLLKGVVSSTRDKLSSWQGAIAIADDSLKIKLSGGPSGSTPADTSELPVSWVTHAKPLESPLARIFPKTTTGFLRLRVNLDKVRKLPSFLRSRVIPEQIPGLESAPLPILNDLIELIEGDIAIAFLGLDENATLGSFGRGIDARSLPLLHLAIAARLRDAAALRRNFEGIAEQLSTSGWTVAPINGKSPEKKGQAPWGGWTFVRDGQHYSILIDNEVCVFLLGAGEVDGFLGVREGRSLSLASLAEGESSSLLKNALGLEATGGSFGALVMTPLRLGRELAARNVPPYFLKVLNDLRVLSIGLDATDKTLSLSLEVDL